MVDPKDDELERRLQELPREVAPPRDLWPEIDAKIETRARLARRPSRAVAAAFVGAIVIAAAVALVVRGQGASERRAGNGAPDAVASGFSGALSPTPSAPAVPEALAADDAAYETAAATLRAELEARRAEEPASAVAVVDENVRIVDDAIRAVRAALAAHPDDPELRADLDRAREDKLDVLRAATELPPTISTGPGAR